jgi:hypothetical protein
MLATFSPSAFMRRTSASCSRVTLIGVQIPAGRPRCLPAEMDSDVLIGALSMTQPPAPVARKLYVTRYTILASQVVILRSFGPGF